MEFKFKVMINNYIWKNMPSKVLRENVFEKNASVLNYIINLSIDYTLIREIVIEKIPRILIQNINNPEEKLKIHIK